VLGREELMELVKGTAEDAFDRSIDVHVCRIRAKLGANIQHRRMLRTVRGMGYLLTTTTEDVAPAADDPAPVIDQRVHAASA
jgi:DNA-binding response OmpR family regulator